MFALRNAWAALMRHKLRTLLVVLVSLLTVIGTMASASVIHQANYMATTAYDQQKPFAQIRPNASLLADRAGDNSAYTDHYLTWDQYTEISNLLNAAHVRFGYSICESVPVRSSKTLQPVMSNATKDADESKTGGDFTLQSFYTAEAKQLNEWGPYTIVSGQDVSFNAQTDLTARDAIISESLANKNHLKVGDKFTIGNPTDTKTTYEYTVSGIYRYTGEPLDGSIAANGTDATFAKDDRENVIYTSYYTFAVTGLDVTGTKGWAKPDLNIVFTLDSPKTFEALKKAIADSKFAKDYTVSSPTLDAYQQSHAGLDAVRQNMVIMLVCTLSIGGALLLLFTLLGCVPRREEIGNALLVGVTRVQLGWQFMLEVFLPMFLGAFIGWIIGVFASDPLGNAISSTQLVQITGAIKGNTAWIGALAILVFMIIAAVRVACFPKMALFTSPYAPDPNSIERAGMQVPATQAAFAEQHDQQLDTHIDDRNHVDGNIDDPDQNDPQEQ
ncbi:ABC transporter permease [Bifidobacterium gallicum]|uniref:ABC transporter permease n=1 Tax=Bifidobacterium gallicum DSM 20093 = LMG 11596 TaxID=561180 RepID=D1NVR5_9BIFI|nr:ABC transporter permease [Bifidobacterium gallicum]EFA22916.1 efflux ABC transporter, permease protein [Bifidobacterium gallicum DSM 20093 = LMG 11596]KFI59386.1 ABC transporter permease [Bifidobacterium gallicum DSM 20093 = LMG 11596]